MELVERMMPVRVVSVPETLSRENRPSFSA